ncbi:hypothetical protein JOM56_000342 [Amanita muscaria]
MDRGYRVLLGHLHSESPVVGLEPIQAALSHHLAHLSPLPTPLAATVVSSPLFLSQPFTHQKLQSLSTAFRHAVHFRLQILEKRAENRSTVASLFSSTIQTALAQWIIDVANGLQGGQPVVRLACLTGLLLGVEDVERAMREEKQTSLDLGRGRDMVENELVIAVAEVVDSYGVEPLSEWEKEFRPILSESQTLRLSLILASQCLPLVSRTRLEALPLPVINGMLVSTIKQAFRSGTFVSPLTQLPSSSTMGPLQIPSTVAQSVKDLTSSLPYASIALLSKLTALTLEVMLDTTRSQRMHQAMETAIAALSAFKQMAETIESDWNSSSLVGRNVDDIDSNSQEVSKQLWSTFKTFLFSTVMVSQAALSTVVYVPPHLFAPSSRPTHLALQVFETLYHLSFVVSEFGGVTADSNSFAELKRVTYLALDILCQDPKEADRFVKRVCVPLGQTKQVNLHEQVRRQKKMFVLSCLEQLVPVLSLECIRDWVWEMAYPHLSESSHREIYESAHSVILAIFASHASSCDQETEEQTKIEDGPFPNNFVTRIIPFYAHCLVENSADHKLSATQLQLAYSALVRSSAVSGGVNTQSSAALAWYCIDTLFEAFDDFESVKGKQKEMQNTSQDSAAHLHRLHLTLIATVSSLPLSLMLPVLDKIADILREGTARGVSQEQKEELRSALFKEILEKVGEKQAAMRWWFDNLQSLEEDAVDCERVVGDVERPEL